MSTAKKRITQILAKSERLPALSTAVVEVIRLSGDSSVSAGRLARTLTTDQHLASRVLKLANSPYYGLCREVAILSDAVCLLGNVMVRNLALLASAEEWFSDSSIQNSARIRAMWKRAVAVSIGSHVIGSAHSSSLGEEALSAGLLHDVGKLVLLNYQPSTFEKVAAHAADKSMPIWVAERTGFGVSHGELGHALATPWQLPERLLDSILRHHQPSEGGDPNPLCDVVHTADVLVRALGIGLTGDDYLVAIDREAMARAGILTRKDVVSTMEAIESGLAQAYDLLEAA
jgi:HD-like signal output (HDOD) protein